MPHLSRAETPVLIGRGYQHSETEHQHPRKRKRKRKRIKGKGPVKVQRAAAQEHLQALDRILQLTAKIGIRELL